MRLPLHSAQRQATAKTFSMPCPVLGLNGRDAVSDMDPRYALKLDNWFPSTNQLIGRAGSASWATGMGTGSVETVACFSNGTTEKMIAFANKAVYDVSSSGAVGAALASGYNNNRWQYVNYKANLIAVNASVDGCIKYDGSTVASNSVTGATGDLANVYVFQNRLYFLDNTLSFYYLGTQAISGALTAFDLSTYCRFGGYLMAMGDWSYLGQNSINDYAVFITSEGEVIVFEGTDPTSSATWQMSAVFRIGKPIGRRCMVKYGAELIIITEDGFVPASSLIGFSGQNRETPQQNISDALGTLITQDVHSYGGNFGWEGVICARSSLGPMAIFNVPSAENSTSYQYVLNLRTFAWCRFVGMNANTFCVYNDKIFFGGQGGIVYQADTGAADAGGNITFDAKTAFSYMQVPDQLKQFVMARPLISANGTVTPAVACCVDFNDILPTTTPTFSGGGGSAWNTSPWNTSPWGVNSTFPPEWIGVGGLGYAAALRVQIATNALMVTWASTDWMFLLGAFM